LHLQQTAVYFSSAHKNKPQSVANAISLVLVKHLFANYLTQLNGLTNTSDIAFATDCGLFLWAEEKLK